MRRVPPPGVRVLAIPILKCGRSAGHDGKAARVHPRSMHWWLPLSRSTLTNHWQPVALRRRLARAVSTAARFNDALTELTTQRKAACITYTVDPFRESAARMARSPPWKRGGP
jgi:hypothetical protein